MMHSRKAIVIGSGIAGMATAIRLAVQGLEVNVYEKNAYPGGKLASFTKDGYQFDSGPSLFTQPNLIRELFELANEPMDEYFGFRPVEATCKYFYENGRKITAWADLERYATELAHETGEKETRLMKYLEASGKLFNSLGSVFLDHSLHKRNTWLHPRIIKALKEVKWPYLFSTLDSYNKSRFETPEVRQLFNRYATYNGSDPYKAPGMLSMIPHLEQNEGVFYPSGGMISITQALYKLALKKGVCFFFDSPVQRIIHNQGRARGIVIKEENHFADIIISNADIYFTYQRLLGHMLKSKKVLKQERSSSAVIFYWGIKGSFPELQLHNIFFSNDYREEFYQIFEKGTISDDPTVYINITSKMDKTHAPPNGENWFVMINAPANKGQDWEAIKTRLRQQVINKLNRLLHCDIGSLIVTEETGDPVSIEENTGSYMGSLYGTSSNSRMAAFLRHPNFSRYVKGLYFCGGSVHPGGGIPLCFKSAYITSGIISGDLKKAIKH